MLQGLLRHLNEPETVIFVGSGVSRWSGLPSWDRMICELADFLDDSGKPSDLVREEQHNGELLQAASYAFDQLTQPQIGEFIRLACRYGTAKPHEIHRKIVELGPTSFVTTNYDNLLEEALRIFQPDTFFAPPVTNRHLTEMASVAHARKSDFIFKPHGDASDAESIILTREQYRKLLPQGEWNRALETLKTLMISRPVLYVGFGLRDPDFLYLRDLLANTYEGAVRDHYAILPNMNDQEIAYWRRSYGIQIISYQAGEDEDVKVAHDALLDLLQNLKEQKPNANEIAGNETQEADFLLAITRYATRVLRSRPTESKVEISVEYQGDNNHISFRRRLENRYKNVGDLLLNGPQKIILIGLPGAGKSFSISSAAADLAETLRLATLEENTDLGDPSIPVIVDMKQYAGNLWNLAEDSLPRGISLKFLLKSYKVKFFIDSFNEMPKKYWSDASYEQDLNDFLKNSQSASVIIASRTEHGLRLADFKSFTLENIDEKLAEAALFENGYKPDGVFRKEMVNLIRRPFFYRLLKNKTISVNSSTEPRAVFDQIFLRLDEKCERRFAAHFSLLPILQELAFKTLNNGTETFRVSESEDIFETSMKDQNKTDIEAIDVVNWLVSEQAIQPLPKGRLAFFHQSITEYLAASRLASLYEEDPRVLQDVLRFRRWDQAIMQAVMLLPKKKAKSGIAQIVAADYKLALSSCKYIEADRDKTINDVLEQSLRLSRRERSEDHSLEWAIQRDLPLNKYHLPFLRKCMEMRGTIGAAATNRFAEIVGSDAKEALLSMLLENDQDYNFHVNGAGRALASLLTTSDLPRIAEWVDAHTTSGDEDDMTASVFATALSNLPADEIVRFLAPDLGRKVIKPLASNILCSIAQDKRTQEWLDVGLQLLPLSRLAAFPIYTILKYGRPPKALSVDDLRENDIDRLIDGMWEGDQWCFNALTQICRVSAKSYNIVATRREQVPGLRAVALKLCLEPNEFKSMIDWLEQFANGAVEYGPEISAINLRKLDWAGKSGLLLRLLNLQDGILANALLPPGVPTEIETLGIFDFDDIKKYLEWVKDLKNSEEFEGRFLGDQLASLMGHHCSAPSKQRLLSELDNTDSPYRKIIAQNILGYCGNLMMTELSDRSISYLLAALRTSKQKPWEPCILSRTADESFVDEALLPLKSDEDDTFQSNLRRVLERIGQRHGKRYLM
jgi:SIR2-like domain